VTGVTAALVPLLAGNNWGHWNDPPNDPHIAYSNGHGVELAIPFADLGIAPTATVNLEFFVTRHTAIEGIYGAIDTLPSDTQSPSEHAGTAQHHLATWPPPPPPSPPPPPGPCDSALLGDGAIITATLAHLDTDSTYRSPTGTLSAGQAVTLSLKSCAHDLTSVALLLWNPSDPLAAPSITYPLTATTAISPAYTLWRVVVPPPATATDRHYAFRLTDNATTNYLHPTQPNTGPAQWSPTLHANRWLLAMSAPPPPPPPPDWRLYLPNLLR
ncbi:MAG: hypothetical protein ABI847_04470, partial [Anaerolineales bacterium]